MQASMEKLTQRAEDLWKRRFKKFGSEELWGEQARQSAEMPALIKCVQGFHQDYETLSENLGPAKNLALYRFMERKAPLLSRLVKLSEKQAKEYEVEMCLGEQLRREGSAGQLLLANLIKETQEEERMHLEALSAAHKVALGEELSKQEQESISVTKAALQQMEQATSEALQTAEDNRRNYLNEVNKTMEGMTQHLQSTGRALQAASDKNQESQEKVKEMNRPKPGFWDTFGQWFITAAAGVGGVALCVFGGPVGAVIGGALISQAVSTGMKLAMNKGQAIDWCDYGLESATSFGTGLLGGGLSLGAGAALGAVVSGWCKAATVGAYGLTYALSGAATSSISSIVDNARHGRAWNEGTWKGALAGGCTGFVSGIMAGGAEVISKSLEASKAASSSVSSIAQRSATESTKVSNHIGSIIGHTAHTAVDSVGCGALEGTLNAAFSGGNIRDAALMGLVGGAVSFGISAGIKAGHGLKKLHQKSKAVKNIIDHDPVLLDAQGKPSRAKHDHTFIHHEATITKAEQIQRITGGLAGSATTNTAGSFKTGKFQEVCVKGHAKVQNQKIEIEQKFAQKAAAKNQLKMAQKNLADVKAKEPKNFEAIQGAALSVKDCSDHLKACEKDIKQLPKYKKKGTVHYNPKPEIVVDVPDCGTSWKAVGFQKNPDGTIKKTGTIKQVKECDQAKFGVSFVYNEATQQAVPTIHSAYPVAGDKKYQKCWDLTLHSMEALGPQSGLQKSIQHDFQKLEETEEAHWSASRREWSSPSLDQECPFENPFRVVP